MKCPICNSRNKKVIIYKRDLWMDLVSIFFGIIIGFFIGVII